MESDSEGSTGGSDGSQSETYEGSDDEPSRVSTSRSDDLHPTSWCKACGFSFERLGKDINAMREFGETFEKELIPVKQGTKDFSEDLFWKLSDLAICTAKAKYCCEGTRLILSDSVRDYRQSVEGLEEIAKVLRRTVEENEKASKAWEDMYTVEDRMRELEAENTALKNRLTQLEQHCCLASPSRTRG